jgi:hypothetical protein
MELLLLEHRRHLMLQQLVEHPPMRGTMKLLHQLHLLHLLPLLVHL